MTIYHFNEQDRTLGSRPIEEASLPAPADDARFRMPDADLERLLKDRGQMEFYIGGAPPEKNYDANAVLSKRALSGFDPF